MVSGQQTLSPGSKISKLTGEDKENDMGTLESQGITSQKASSRTGTEHSKAPKESNHLVPPPLQLVNENKFLREELSRHQQKLAKSEDKLEKKRQFIREMNFLQNDISQIKASMKQDAELKQVASRESLTASPYKEDA